MRKLLIILCFISSQAFSNAELIAYYSAGEDFVTYNGEVYYHVFSCKNTTTSVVNLWLEDGGGDACVADFGAGVEPISNSSYTTSSITTDSVRIYSRDRDLSAMRSATNYFYFDIATLPSSLVVFTLTGNNTTFGDIADLPAGLTEYTNVGSNTVTGNVGDLPTGLTYFRSIGSNTTFGDIADLPTGLTYYNNSGSNTTTGDIANLPTGLTYFRNVGGNTTSGDIANLPTGLTYYYNIGSNTTTGDIADLPTGLTYYYNSGNNTVSDYTSPSTFNASLSGLITIPAAGGGLNSTEVDNLIIDLNTSLISNATITITGGNALRTSASDAAVLALEGRGCTITTN